MKTRPLKKIFLIASHFENVPGILFFISRPFAVTKKINFCLASDAQTAAAAILSGCAMHAM